MPIIKKLLWAAGGLIGGNILLFNWISYDRIWQPQIDNIKKSVRIKIYGMTEKDIMYEIIPQSEYIFKYDENGKLTGLHAAADHLFNEYLELFNKQKINPKYNKIITSELLKKLEEIKNNNNL